MSRVHMYTLKRVCGWVGGHVGARPPMCERETERYTEGERDKESIQLEIFQEKDIIS